MIEVRWTEQAVEDLAGIKAFISQDSPAYALASLVGFTTPLGSSPISRIRGGSYRRSDAPTFVSWCVLRIESCTGAFPIF